MLKFKAGDKVRCNRSSGCGGFIKGHIYTVFHDYDDSFTVEKDSRGVNNGWSNIYFELVQEPKTNPLIETVTRTVTRTIEEEVTEQKLKSGVYGQVDINEFESVCLVGRYDHKMNLQPDKLDETIDALIAVRDHWRAVGKIK